MPLVRRDLVTVEGSVTLVDGSIVEVSNLGTMEVLLAAISANSKISSDALTSVISDTGGSTTLKTKDLTITELLKEISMTLKFIKKQGDLITGENIKERDIGD